MYLKKKYLKIIVFVPTYFIKATQSKKSFCNNLNKCKTLIINIRGQQ